MKVQYIWSESDGSFGAGGPIADDSADTGWKVSLGPISSANVIPSPSGWATDEILVAITDDDWFNGGMVGGTAVPTLSLQNRLAQPAWSWQGEDAPSAIVDDSDVFNEGIALALMAPNAGAINKRSLGQIVDMSADAITGATAPPPTGTWWHKHEFF